MNAPEVIAALDIGAPIEGGFFAGRIRSNDQVYGIAVAPKADGEHVPITWSKTRKRLDGALSFHDGGANTQALLDAGSPLATWARGLRIAGYDDWYLPSRDELELCYRHFKPGTYETYVWRNGDNPSSLPPGYPYDATLVQTTHAAFQAGNSEAFSEEWYWTSTQYAGNDEYAWYQRFDTGYQDDYHEYYKLRARAVRRFVL